MAEPRRSRQQPAHHPPGTRRHPKHRRGLAHRRDAAARIAQFGRRAEKLDPDQRELALEDVEQSHASDEAGAEAKDLERRKTRAARRRRNRGSLPAHLPRIEQVVDVEDKSCPCCSGALHRIGEDIAERLDVIPAQFRVLVVRRPKYACRKCQEVVLQAPAPARLIEGGLPTEALVAHVQKSGLNLTNQMIAVG